MTQQIKIPLLPLPPVDYIGIIIVAYDDYLCPVYWSPANRCWVDSIGGNLIDETKIIGRIPDYKVVDGQIVFEVQNDNYNAT